MGEALLAKGHAAQDLPKERTLRDSLNRMNYRRKRSQKGKPLKKTKETDALFANVRAARQEVHGDSETLAIAIDTKAKVPVGAYGRGGKNPDGPGRQAGARVGP